MKSGSLNLLEPSGPHRACYGTALPLLSGLCHVLGIVYRLLRSGTSVGGGGMGMLLEVTLDKRIPIMLLNVFMQLEDLLSRIHPADHF